MKRDNASSSLPAEDNAPGFLVRLASALFLSYMAVALPLAVIPQFVTLQLGFPNVWGGLGVGIAFLSTILTRNHAGMYADKHGARPCMRIGLGLYIAASLVGILAGWETLSPSLQLGFLLAGRLLLGVGESMTIVGMHAWGIGLMGPPRSGRVMAWTGAAMYGAFALGSPIGLAIFHHTGFGALMLTSAFLPLVGLLLVQGVPPSPVLNGKRGSLLSVLGSIRGHGFAVALQGVGFAALGAFLATYFAHRGWSFGSLGLTCFGCAFVLCRAFFGHLPDRIGGLRVAGISLMVEAVGQFLIFMAPSPLLALCGATLTGMGCSMIYPSLGVEVVKSVPAAARATALGGFAAFQDLSYAVTSPFAGIVADHYGYRAIFLSGTVCALIALITVGTMQARQLRTLETGGK